jgi:DNA-binding transcriptional MocR family regulator
LLLLTIDATRPEPAYVQIRDRIVALVDEGALRAGDRLPSTRALADAIAVHRTTVVRAYDEARALGYLESRPGSYTIVRQRARPLATTATRPKRREPALVDWPGLATAPVRETHQLESTENRADRPPDTIDFERLAADPNLAPAEDLRRSLKNVLVRGGPASLDYAEPAGWRPLRVTISRRMRAHGIAVSADEILITSGAQQALDLALRLLTRAGDRVVVEAPTYSMAHALRRLHGVDAIEIPMREDGMDLDELERVLERTDVKLVYTMPNFHNPTGVTTGQAHRERLLALCERHATPLVEDGFEEEMKYFGKAVLPIKSMDVCGIVLYVGTFSKVVFPGLRVGWIAAPKPAIDLLSSIQHASCLAANTLAQAVADRFCRSGEFECHLRRIHRVYRRRMQALLDGLERHLPPEVQWTRPSGGYTLWLTLPGRGAEERGWYEHLARAGVQVAAGSGFFGSPPTKVHLRLSICCVDESQITEGCRRLGDALRRPP